LSDPDGGHGPFYVASHIQNTTGEGSGGSGWVTGPGIVIPGGGVPEPSSALLAIVAFLSAAVVRRNSM
jgi:hypothetical protein